MPDRRTPDRFAEAVRNLLHGRATREPSPGDAQARLDTIERELQEVRTRVNALFFAVIAVAIGDVFARAVLS